MADIERNAERRGSSGGGPAVGTIGEPVPRPSSRYRGVRGGGVFEASVPDNWQALSSNNAVKYVPRNAYGEANGQTVFTHGVELGIARASSRDLESATAALVDLLGRSNPDLRLAGAQQTTRISRRTAIATPLANRTRRGGRERIGLYTTFLADGNLFYYLTVAPEDEYAAYRQAFDRVGGSIRLTDTR
jgi:hypothetical protein